MLKKKKNFFIFLMALVIIGLTVISYTFFVIYQGVKSNCLEAKSEFKKDCVSSLMEAVKSEDKPFRKRNSAVWALGQIADKKALPFLYQLKESLPEGEKCIHDQYLCRYEIQKAINWCEQGNVTNWMYKNKDSWQ